MNIFTKTDLQQKYFVARNKMNTWLHFSTKWGKPKGNIFIFVLSSKRNFFLKGGGMTPTASLQLRCCGSIWKWGYSALLKPVTKMLKINKKKKKKLLPQITSQVLYKFYGESFCCNVIILNAIVLLQNQILRDKKQNSVGICTTLTIISFFLVLYLMPFVSNTAFITSLSSQVCVFTAGYRL